MILTDNGREFDNELLRDLSQNINTVVKTTAAYSPWSNGLNERHNAVLGEMVMKTLEDSVCDIDTALSWAVCAKNCLHNCGGFSPNQLVFGNNPSLPSVLRNKLPALENISCSQMIADNLNALHSARKAFIQAESSEKIQRALRHNVRGFSGLEYSNGDLVYYKRPSSDIWMGPGTVIGCENKQVVLKHGGAHYKVHPCKLQPYLGGDSDLSVDSNHAFEEHVEDGYTTRTDPLNSTRTDLSPNVEDVSAEEQEPPVKETTEATPNSRLASTENLLPTSNTTSNVLSRKRDQIILPKPGSEIRCRLINGAGDEGWRKMKIIRKGGKASGKN